MSPNDSTGGQAGAVITRPAFGYDGISGGLRARVIATVRVWRDRAAQRRALGRLDEHLLMDIGVDRVTAKREASKPFWRS